MKLLKQNDNAGGLIFKQNVNGKAMKQNYSFGRGFNKGSANCYIECPVVPVMYEPFTILTWNDIRPDTEITNIESTSFLIRDEDDSCKLSLGVRLYARGILLTRANIWNAGGTSTIDSRNFGSLRLGQIGIRCDRNNFQAIFTGANKGNTISLTTLNQSAITNLYVGLFQFNGLKRETRLIRDFKLYSRHIGDSEINYLYNNALGNDPLSVLGLQAWYRMERAEILMYKGNLEVCVRDYSGNENHGFIHDLPAGTLEEKVNWANNNIFLLNL